MGKILVKAPQTMMDSKGNVQFLYGGGDKGGDKGSLPARFLGGAGKVLGGALGAAGPHRSLMSLLGGIQSGAATGQQAGRWAGGFADKLPGGRVRTARRGIREKGKEKYADLRARELESGDKRFTSGSVGIRPSTRRATRRERLGLENTRAQREKEQEEARKHIIRLERAKAWREAGKSPSNEDALIEAMLESQGGLGSAARAAQADKAGTEVHNTANSVAAQVPMPPLQTPETSVTNQGPAANNEGVAIGHHEEIFPTAGVAPGMTAEQIKEILAANSKLGGKEFGQASQLPPPEEVPA